MPEAVYDAHLYFGIHAGEHQRDNEGSALRPVTYALELQHSLDLGEYSVAKFTELLVYLEEHVEAWVEANPPA